MSELPSDLVTYSRPVRHIHWNNSESKVDTVTVECDDGEKIAANHVIVTVPLGRLLLTYRTILHLWKLDIVISPTHVICMNFFFTSGYLKKHYSTLFCPPLPAHKLHSIQKLGFGTCNKIYVEFESPWWDADCEVIYLVWKDEVCSAAVNHQIHLHTYTNMFLLIVEPKSNLPLLSY